MSNSKHNPIAAAKFREVLGHFPTGVAVITAIGLDGEPLGMAVGSFASVSLNPPLVTFLPDRGSSTFPAIRDAGRFCVNVLAGYQEDVCRVFATRGANRFESVKWRPAPHTGSPVLEGAVAWIDCELGDIHQAGDHDIVIGRVLGLEVESPHLPLLFFQGGYGTFAPRSLVMASQGRPSQALQVVATVREELEDLASEASLKCRAFALESDGLRLLATAGPTDSSEPVGAVLPWFPPIGATLAAFGSQEKRQQWYENFPAELSEERRAQLDLQLDHIEQRGWGIAFEDAETIAIESLFKSMAEYGPTPRIARTLSDTAVNSGLGDPELLDASNANRVRNLTAPVFMNGEPLLHLTLRGFPLDATLEFVEHARDVLVKVSRQISERSVP